MQKNMHKTRRDFLKTSAAVAGISLTGGASHVLAKQSAWSTGTQINPNIDNLRVVCVNDPTMLNGVALKWDAASQNQYVVRNRVHANIDAMAQKLVEPTNPTVTADQAWQLILRKPAAKQWNNVKVAFKVNCLEKNLCTKFAVIEKLCLVLNGWGVPFTNMYIYDRVTNAYPSYANFVGAGQPLPAGIVVCNPEMGPKGSVTITGFGAGHDCAGYIADGSIDILINCPSNKGHDDAGDHGRCTLSMKNHYGTCFTANQHQGFAYTVAMNQSDYILGGTPVRQQLVFCESLYAMSSGPNGTPDKTLNRLVMGVFGPAVDYLIATKLRAGVMGIAYTPAEQAIFTSYLTNFGYTAAQFTNLDLVTVPATTAHAELRPSFASGRATKVRVSLVSGQYRSTGVDLILPNQNGKIDISVFDISGRLAKTLTPVSRTAGSCTALWDAKTSSGSLASEGRYLVTASSAGFSTNGSLVLVR